MAGCHMPEEMAKRYKEQSSKLRYKGPGLLIRASYAQIEVCVCVLDMNLDGTCILYDFQIWAKSDAYQAGCRQLTFSSKGCGV
jgi:hypothetical protein